MIPLIPLVVTPLLQLVFRLLHNKGVTYGIIKLIIDIYRDNQVTGITHNNRPLFLAERAYDKAIPLDFYY